jgi:TolB-like protein/Tfp pilus assembly protein PilF
MEAALREVPEGIRVGGATRGWSTFARPVLAVAAVAILAVGVSLAAIVWSRTGDGTPVATSSRIRSVAMLPLEDLSGPSASAYFAPALTDQLIATLGQIGSLRVASRTSVMQFTGARPSLQQMFDTLGVDALIEGTVAVSPGEGDRPGRVRVNARLIAAGSRTPRWQQSFERPLGETLALQSELARHIANEVRTTLTDAESRRLAQVRSTSAAAEEAYFQGRYHLGQYGIDRARRALDAFNRAIELDPAHASARAGAARAYISLGADGALSEPDARASALREVNKALEVSEELPEAHASLGDLKFRYDWDWVAGEREYRRAIELNPSYTYARSQYARYLAAAGRLDEATDESSAARELDPLSADAAQTHGLILYYRRDFPGAIDALTRALDLDPGYARAQYVLGRVYEAQGMIDQAIASTDKALKLAPEAGVTWRLQQIRLKALAGRRDEARTDMKALLAELQRQKLRVSAQDLGYFHAALGEPQLALNYLERAVDERDPRILWLRVDPRVDTLRNDPRFGALIRRLGLTQP